MTTSIELITAAAEAVAAALPVPSALTAGHPVATGQLTELPSSLLPENAGTAVLSRLAVMPGSSVGGEVVVIVGVDLVEALATSPLGALKVPAAVQPALDAAAAAVGGASAPGEQLEVDAALGMLLARPDAHLVALSGPDGLVLATVLVALEPTAAATPGFEPAPEPAVADPDVPTVGTSPAPQVQIPAQTGGVAPARIQVSDRGGLDLLRDVAMEVTVELGRTRMTVRELLSLSPGGVVELDRAAGSPADLLVNGTMIARGEIVVIDEDFGIRITAIVTSGADGIGDLATSDLGAA
jgi:flagellar motor switch protein FliN/FliY